MDIYIEFIKYCVGILYKEFEIENLEIKEYKELKDNIIVFRFKEKNSKNIYFIRLNDLKIKRQRRETELKILNDSIKAYESKRSTNE